MFRNLKDIWDAIMREYFGQTVSHTFRNKTGEECNKEVPMVFTKSGNKNFLKQPSQNFFSECAAMK